MSTVLNQESGERRQPGYRNSAVWAWVATGLGVAISFTLFLLVWRAEKKRDATEFEGQVQRYLNGLQVRRVASEDLLRALSALFHQDPKLSRRLFGDTVQQLEIRREGIQALGWAPRVTKEKREQFEQNVRQEGFASFQISEGDLAHVPETATTRAADRAEYFPILFLEPMTGNGAALGFDLGSESILSELLTRAKYISQTEVSGPIDIRFEQQVRTGVIAAIPVFSPEFLPATKEERNTQLQGYVFGAFIIDEMLADIESRSHGLRLDVMLLDSTNPEREELMSMRIHGQASSKGNNANLAHFSKVPHLTQPVDIGGRHLTFVFRRSAAWAKASGWWIPAAVLGVSLLLTGFLGQYIWASGERAVRIEAVVQARTGELAQVNARLQQEARERLEAQYELVGERNLLYLLLNQLPDAVYVTDREGKCVLSNEAHTRLLGQVNAAHQATDGSPTTEGPSLADALASGSSEVLRSGAPILDQEITLQLSPEAIRHFEVSKLPFRDARGEIDGLLSIARDVTEHKQAEAQKLEFTQKLQETQRLESLGILAGGIAHDFNNLLTTILGNANLARGEVGADSSAAKCLQRIEATSIRAANLCKQMLAYSGRGHFVVRRLDLSQLVEQTTELLRLSVNKKAWLDRQLAFGLTPVMGDATQLQQILMNLVINASEAVGEQEGVIRIRTGVQRVDSDYLRQAAVPSETKEGQYVFLEVSDNGCGMSPETQAKVFDPFFTTKFTGRGLGLAAALGIVRGHRGFITVQSELGVGSTFKLLLPMAEGAVEPLEGPKPGNDDWKGAGTLLIVEDEAEVRATTVLMLERAGFNLDQAEDGRRALQKYRESPDRYSAVLLDLTMPQVDGVEAFREIRRIRPDARVLVMSGFSPQDAVGRFEGNGPSGFIQKPFQLKDLLSELRKIL